VAIVSTKGILTLILYKFGCPGSVSPKQQALLIVVSVNKELSSLPDDLPVADKKFE
jgi:hypothetical protein